MLGAVIPVLAILALTSFSAFESAQIQPIKDAIREQLGGTSTARSIRALPPAARRSLLRFYEARGHGPMWVDAGGVTPAAEELLAELAKAGEHGLDSARYGLSSARTLVARAERSSRTPPPARTLARLELALSASLARYASDLLDGRLSPSQLPSGWHTRPRRADWTKVWTEAASSGPAAVLRKLEPPHSEYGRLRSTLLELRRVQGAGGWPTLPAGPELRRGSRGPRVLALRHRLGASGDLKTAPARSSVFDGAVESAVRRFQERHGLAPTGRVGRNELRALNVPVDRRIRQIALNLERWRWMPADLGERRIVINIPDYALRVVEKSRPVLAMRVIVGNEYTRTPVFTDTVRAIVFNPYWNIPETIAWAEYADVARRNPYWLRRRGIRIVEASRGRELHPKYVRDWDLLLRPGSGFRLRQDPGPDNPLGRIKFVLRNRFQVYLHDTPSDHLFAFGARDLSHGCIRVEKPTELAAYLLGRAGWSGGRVVDAMSTSVDRTVPVPDPVPVHVLYWTAWVDDQDRLHLRDDIYGIDAALERALRRTAG